MIFKTVKDDSAKPLPLRVNWDLILKFLAGIKDGKPVIMEIKRKRPTISDPMRKWYFSTVLPGLCEACGYEPDDYMEVHRQLKILFFNCQPDKRGICAKVPSVFSNKSEAEIPVKKKFIDWVIRKAAENGKYIEDPN